MLNYIEHSTKDNVRNDNLNKIQELVDEIKYDGEVGIQFMKSWEIEEMRRYLHSH